MTAGRLCKIFVYMHKNSQRLIKSTQKPCQFYNSPLVNVIHKRCLSELNQNPIECWKCGTKKHEIQELFCAQCKTIQNPHEYKNCFTVLGLKQDYNVDQKELTRIYREMQTQLHPDKFSNKSEEEQTISEEYSSLVNHAYKTLQSPMSRALHMLTLNGESVTDTDQINDQKFLLQIMDLSEEVEEAHTFQQLKKLEEKNNATLERMAQDIGKLLKSKDIKTAKEMTIRMQYYHTVNKQISNTLREMGFIE